MDKLVAEEWAPPREQGAGEGSRASADGAPDPHRRFTGSVSIGEARSER